MRNNLGGFLAKRAQLSPTLEALVEVERGRRFTYAELDARANRIAAALRSRGIGPGDRVAFLLMNGAEYVEAYYGVAKLGAVMVPLNWRLVPDELSFILSDAGAVALIFDSEFDEAAAALHAGDTELRIWLRVGDEAGAAATGFADDYDTACEAESGEPVTSDVCDDDMLFIMYTSGTTGLPKGAVHTHNTMAAASITMNMTADSRMSDRYLQMLPLFHVGALTPMTGCLHRGSAVILMRQFDPAAVFPLIEAEKITAGLAVPAMLNFMLASGGHETNDTSTVRWMMSGAAPVPVALIEKYAELGIEIHQVYGLTETCGPACLISPEEALAKAGSTGPAFFHTDVRVVDADGADVAPGEVGEVTIRGAHIMKE